MSKPAPRALRSRAWFDNPASPDLTALYIEKYLNYGLSLEELQGDRPIVGIAQTGSDLAPCNRHHLVLAERVKQGIRDAGGIPLEFPIHPIQETGKRPTAGLDRNLAYLSLVELLYGYPIDGVVLTVGCDKTTPACLMAAATVNIPAIALSVGPMLNGWHRGERVGSGTIVWKARRMLAAGEIDYKGFVELVASSAPSTGFCNTMGTATTMNSLTEALGMSLPGSAAIPAPYRDRLECAWRTGRQIVEMVRADRKPSDILTRAAFINAIRVNSALGGSTNAPIHLNAIARHAGVELTLDDWERFGHGIPLLVNLQPAGEYLGEDFYHAGGVPAVVGELLRAGCIEGDVLTANGRTIRENCASARSLERGCHSPLRRAAEAERRAHRVARQSVRFGDHEDQRDLRGVPRAVSVRSARSGCVRRPRRRVRRTRGLSLAHRRSGARDRRAHAARHARHGTVRLSGRRRSREHAAAGGADSRRRRCSALHRRWTPVRHVGIAVDSQRCARGGSRRRTRAAAHGRSRAGGSEAARSEHARVDRGNRATSRGARIERRLLRIRRRKRRGRKSIASSPASSIPARCSNAR